MPSTADYLAACRKAAREHGLSPDLERLLILVAPLFARGQFAAQVPAHDAGDEAFARAVAGRGCIGDVVAGLVEEGRLAWKTSRGWSHDPEGRNPATGRAQPSRMLWVTRDTVDELSPALHALYVDGAEEIRRKAETSPAYLRESYMARYVKAKATSADEFHAVLSAAAAPASQRTPLPSMA